MAGLLDIAYDAASLSAIANFSNFQNYLTPEMSAAMEKIGELLVPAVQTNTWTAFKNPTGELASKITAQMAGPMEVIIDVDAPQARRLEYGFGPGGSAQADSLGRIYHNPPEPYAQPALDANEDQIAQMMDDALSAAFIAMGA
jgi:hypothetical protein